MKQTENVPRGIFSVIAMVSKKLFGQREFLKKKSLQKH
jgi:hypothetical protein